MLNIDLRNLLHEITLNHPSIHERLLMERAKNHSINVIAGFGGDLRYNCVMYALNLHDDQCYLELRLKLPQDIHADTNFLKFLIQRDILFEFENGEIAVYFENSQIKHVGIYKSQNTVVSKWGIGLLYEHGLFEVPSNYGETIKNYSIRDSSLIFPFFKKYVESLNN